MSNRIVPATYRAIIDDVMTNIRDHFLELGVDDQVLQSLQNKWEQKVVESDVAEFEPGPPPGAAPVVVPPQQPLHPQPPPSNAHQYNLAVPQQRAQQNNYSASASSSSTNLAPYGGSPAVKTESHDSPYSLPTLAAPGPPGGMQRSMVMGPGGVPQQQYTAAQVQHAMQQGFNPQHLQALAAQQAQMHAARQQLQQQQQQQHAHQKPTPSQLQQAANRLPQVDGPSSFVFNSDPVAGSGTSRRIPQVDGPSSVSSSSSSRSSASPPPPVHTAPAPVAASSSAIRPGDEEIGSDLDDDDSEGEDDEGGAATAADGAGAGDIVYCTYDKVQRVKNKWKCVLKDGIVSVGGKDYLFSKCTGEFEW